MYKKIILLVLTALMMVGCEEKELKEITRHAMIVDLDSCQYVVCNAYGRWAYIHHNNCRFCKERRQKELEELVIKLKEK